MNSDTSLLDKVREAVAQSLRIPPAQIDPNTRFIAELSAESIDLVDIEGELESMTGCEVDLRGMVEERNTRQGTDYADFTVQEVVDYLAWKIQPAEAH